MVTVLRGCFSRFLNYANNTKSHKASKWRQSDVILGYFGGKLRIYPAYTIKANFRKACGNSFSTTFCVWFLKKNGTDVIFY